MEETAATDFCLKMIENPNPTPGGSVNNVQTGDMLIDVLMVCIVLCSIVAISIIEYLLWNKLKSIDKE